MISSWERYKTLGEKATAEGKYDEAADLWVSALDEAENFPPKDPRIPYTIEQLAEVSYKQGKSSLAFELFEKALIIKSDTLGPYHLEVGTSANNLAELYCADGKFNEAEPMFKRVLKIYELAFGSYHVGVAIIAGNLAMMYHQRLNYDEAEPLYKRAIEIYTKLNGYNNPDTVRMMDCYVDLLAKTGREAEALKIKESSSGTVSGIWKMSMAQFPTTTMTKLSPTDKKKQT